MPFVRATGWTSSPKVAAALGGGGAALFLGDAESPGGACNADSLLDLGGGVTSAASSLEPSGLHADI